MNNIPGVSATEASLDIRQRRRAVHAAASSHGSLTTLAVGAAVVAILYFAREIFIPLALAMLLSFVLGPLVMLLRRLHLGQLPSVIAVVLFALLVTGAIGTLIGTQISLLAEELPQYQYNIIQKIHSIKGLGSGNGIVGRTSEFLNRIGGELRKPEPQPQAPVTPKARSDAEQPPIPVEVQQPEPSPVALLMNVLEPLLGPLAMAGIIVVFVVFFLLQREHLRDRFIRLVGADDLRHTTEAMDDAFSRLGRYLLTQTVINTLFGIVIGIGVWMIGIPHPVLWGALALLLRFVPYIGATIAAVFPAAMAIAVDPGWSTLVWTAALFVVVEVVTGQLIEPYHYGRSTGLSTVAVVVAATFWTWLWGPVGLLLSVPLTMCLIVLGRHVSALEFLDILLGDEPALTAEEKFYQRMLSGDSDEAAYQAEDFLKTGPLATYYDEVAVKGLALAQLDVNRGELDHERRVQIKDAVDAVIDDLSDHATPPEPEDGVPLLQNGLASQVLCIAGRGSLDESVAAMLAQLLAKQGVVARVVPNSAVLTPNLAQLDATGVRVVCLSYLEPGDFANARYLVRRLRRKLPDAKIIVGFWTLTEPDVLDRNAAQETTADEVVSSLRLALEVISRMSKEALQRSEPARLLRGTV